ncbi:hypothetical protein JCM10207_002771 [Rhodosporidiobolus poonsookiae]
MFAGSRRAPPKAPGSAQKSATTTVTTTTTVQRAPVAVTSRPPAVSSPLSSVASLSSPPTPAKRPGVKIQTKTVTVVKKVAAPVAPVHRTVNALKRPLPPPKKEEEPPAKRSSKGAAGKAKNGRAKARVVSDSDSSECESSKANKKKKRTNGAAASRKRAQQASSDLDPLTPSEEEDDGSDLSSVDEDYFARSLKKDEGAAVCVRDVAATVEGPMDAMSAEMLVLGNRTAYVEYFLDPSNPERPTSEWAGSDLPSVELEFPAVGATERFALLAPRTDDEYNPIEDVMRTILVVLDHFLTPEQSHTYFGHLPGKTSFSAFLYNKTSASASRSGTPAVSTPAPESPAAAPSPAASAPPSLLQQAATAALASSTSASSTPTPGPAESLVRTLERARSKRDGPSFLAALERFNSTLRQLKSEGVLRTNIAAMKGLKEKVWQKVFYQCYDRAVGPEMEMLMRYEAFSDNVYGELLPGFMNEIFEKTHLGPGKVFVDLGSGVGNCVVQAALATGATSYGFENMPHASKLARDQVVEAEKRFRMWGLAGGAMKCVEADFCDEPEVGKVMRTADVVLVNNEVFTSALNERLSWLFLDLPPSAKIISLKPFLPSKFKITSHNVGSPFAILAQSAPQRYKPGSVSWKMEGGTYFLSRVDRTRVERFERKEMEREEKRRRVARERKERREGSTSTSGASSEAMSRQGSRAGL